MGYEKYREIVLANMIKMGIVLMICSFFVGPYAMPLVFNGYEIAAMIGATWITSYLVHEGRTNWFEGVKLLAAYALVVVVFLFA